MSKKSRRVAKARRMLLTLSLVLVVAMAAVGGTLAWLTSQTDPIINTFTATDITVTLEETLAPEGGTLATSTPWSAPLLPGMTYSKDPVVTIENSTDAYLYVEEVKDDPCNALTYTSTLYTLDDNGNKVAANDWNLLEGVENVYWRRVSKDAAAADKTWNLISGNTVSIGSDKTDTSQQATLTYQAWAIQANALVDQDSDSDIDAKDGWLLLPNP